LSPILVRPVREQLEHDRIIRQLQGKFRRKFDAGINPGAEQNVSPVPGGPGPLPDVVLFSTDRGRKLQGIIEVETGESVNHLEALAEWAHFGRSRAPFHLYVPAGMVDVARRLCEDNQIYVSEIWSFHTVGDQVRFTMVYRNKEAPPPPPKKVPAPPAPKKPAPPPPPKPAAPKPAAPKPAAPKPAPPPKKVKPAVKKKAVAVKKKPAAPVKKKKR
jgi:hypothetical protein